MFTSRSLTVCTLAALALHRGANADLRMAAQPKNGYLVKDRSRVPFVSQDGDTKAARLRNDKFAIYMEPSDFGYKKLKRQRDGGGYDNFLRSNIDNEQDKRNFQTEPGRDHLPFRSYEAAETDAHASQKHKIPKDAPGPAVYVKAGEPYTMPLRWNNPHSSELEVNVWIMDKKYVVPIRKPACSGEGHQNNAFTFTVPADFLKLGSRVPGFKGCKVAGDCVLQIYAHSVESRMYASGTPLIVNGTYAAPTATGKGNIQAAKLDVALDLNKLPLVTCLPSSSAQTDIRSAVPRAARLISDQFNHAYQNSDFSPYAGQQPEAISRNMQAACILKMVTGNRGELGKHKLAKDNRKAFHFQRSIERKAKLMIRVYEGIANQIIAAIGKDMANRDASMKPDDLYIYQNRYTCDGKARPPGQGFNNKAIATLKACEAACAATGKTFNGTRNLTNFPRDCFVSHRDWNRGKIHKEMCYFNAGNGTARQGNRCDSGHRHCLCQGGQVTESCFRCAEVGSVSTRRLTTNTYVPSFRIPKAQLPTALLYIAPIYKDFVRKQSNGDGMLLIYETVLDNMNTQFAKAGTMGLGYMGPAIKSTATTMADATKFLKVNAAGKPDRGYYAATKAQASIKQIMVKASARRQLATGGPPKTAKELIDATADDAQGVFIADVNMDMNGVGYDSSCDDDMGWSNTSNCTLPGRDQPSPWQMFSDAGQVEMRSVSSATAGGSSTEAAGGVGGWTAFGIFVGSFVAAGSFVALVTAAAYFTYSHNLWPCLKSSSTGGYGKTTDESANINMPVV